MDATHFYAPSAHISTGAHRAEHPTFAQKMRSLLEGRRKPSALPRNTSRALRSHLLSLRLPKLDACNARQRARRQVLRQAGAGCSTAGRGPGNGGPVWPS